MTMMMMMMIISPRPFVIGDHLRGGSQPASLAVGEQEDPADTNLLPMATRYAS